MSRSKVEKQRRGPSGRRRRRDTSEWRELIEAHRRSEQTVKDFCAERDVSEASFYAWRRHLYQQADQPGEASNQASKAAPSPTPAKEPASQWADSLTPRPPGDASSPASKAAPPHSADEGPHGPHPAGFVRLDPQAGASGDAIEVRFACGATLRCSSSHLPDLVRLLNHGGEGAESC